MDNLSSKQKAQKRYYEKHKEKKKEYSKDYYEKHKEAILKKLAEKKIQADDDVKLLADIF
jgi:hypothetical protein